MTRKNIPLHQVIREISGCRVIPLSLDDEKDASLLSDIYAVAVCAGKDMLKNPIIKPRANEVGNAIENRVKRAFSICEKCRVAPQAQSAGYPDILIYDRHGRPSYIECKTFNKRNVNDSFRSFFLSPSPTFKVKVDARHLVLSYKMARREENAYTPDGFKIVDICNLPCDLKLEWNSDNKKLYGETAILAETDKLE